MTANGCAQCREMGLPSKGPFFYKGGVPLCPDCAGLDREDVGEDPSPPRPDYDSMRDYMEDHAP